MAPYARDAAPLAPWIERILEANASPLEAAEALVDFNDKED